MITLLNTPAHVIQVSPEVVSRWVATESPNNFQLQRKDIVITGQSETVASPSGYLALTLDSAYTGQVGNSISVYNSTNGAMYTGTITSIASPATNITTDIAWVTGMVITYLNDNTLKAGYYFEGRLTINNVVQSLTIIASPDSFGIADLDVSGVLRIVTTLVKTGDYSDTVIAEPTKSGKFTFEYRESWYGSNESYTAEGNTWYYVEAVRSIEQGSNMYDFLPSDAGDAPFLNAFDKPVYFSGLPFDISFILPVLPITSPVTELTVILNRYNSTNLLLGTTTTVVVLDDLEGKVCSLLIDPAVIEDSAAYLTAEIV